MFALREFSSLKLIKMSLFINDHERTKASVSFLRLFVKCL